MRGRQLSISRRSVQRERLAPTRRAPGLALLLSPIFFFISALPLAAITYDLTFDSHGEADRQVIDIEYQVLYGITISANGNSLTSPDVAVIYDSESPVGADDDLEFDDLNGYAGGGNRQFTRFENLLIVQENGNVVGNFVDSPADDDGNGGTLTFTFDTATHSAVSDVSLSWVDIDPPDGGNYTIDFIDNDAGLSATVNFNQFVTSTAYWYDPTITFGDHTANAFPTIDALDLFLHADVAPAAPMTKFDEMIFNFEAGQGIGSSGSIGVISFTAVPEAGTAGILAVALGSLIMRRRRYGKRVKIAHV